MSRIKKRRRSTTVGLLRLSLISAVVGAFALITSVTQSSADTRQRLVLAAFHPFHFTRDHDGKWGLWNHTGVARRSRANVTRFTSNADLVDMEGRHQIASLLYPVVGPQSERDVDNVRLNLDVLSVSD